MPADCPCQSAGVADRQAALRFSAWDKGFVLQDFNSPHGSFVNGCQVQNAAVKVSPGDILRFGAGGASFELVVDGAAQVRMEGMPRYRWVLLPPEQDQAPRFFWVTLGKSKGWEKEKLELPLLQKLGQFSRRKRKSLGQVSQQ